MTLNERLLDFMDGTLPPDDEAELLHGLSVSPEKRFALRSFMKQESLLVRDKSAISVPYDAEQMLWARVDAILPLPQAAATSTGVGFLTRMMTTASATVGAVGLIVGLSTGYFAASSNAPSVNAPSVAITQRVSAPVVAEQTPTVSSASTTLSFGEKPISVTSHAAASALSSSSEQPVQHLASLLAVPTPESAAQPSEPLLASAQPMAVEPVALRNIGDNIIMPQLHNTRIAPQKKSLIERFEFTVNESFGRQFTTPMPIDVTMPILTNSSVGTYFQLLPNSNFIWVGATVGQSNVLQKSLSVQAGNPIDPLQNVLTADVVHTPQSYAAALVQLRFPAFETAELTFSGGYGLATLGQMMIAELGVHYDVTREVGLNLGLRTMRFSYDLTSQRDALINGQSGTLVVPNGVATATPSFNTEINSGLFFHF